ncbi:hypothetical protein [Streptomyces sp. 769]|uniref:hypothetical protein n=1 Tax=Streptomyces sp. 769 TaxID=1262452 RepID=UPI000581F6DD|nr:hypothetical protein [Streptomyces sp. 769]AJC55055.1 hypothetical protein GZL_02464 [Streptomyces sp. 769]
MPTSPVPRAVTLVYDGPARHIGELPHHFVVSATSIPAARTVLEQLPGFHNWLEEQQEYVVEPAPYVRFLPARSHLGLHKGTTCIDLRRQQAHGLTHPAPTDPIPTCLDHATAQRVFTGALKRPFRFCATATEPVAHVDHNGYAYRVVLPDPGNAFIDGRTGPNGTEALTADATISCTQSLRRANSQRMISAHVRALARRTTPVCPAPPTAAAPHPRHMP